MVTEKTDIGVERYGWNSQKGQFDPQLVTTRWVARVLVGDWFQSITAADGMVGKIIRGNHPIIRKMSGAKSAQRIAASYPHFFASMNA